MNFKDRYYIIYDGRACMSCDYPDTDRASILCCAETLEEASQS